MTSKAAVYEPFTRYVYEDGTSWGFGTIEFAARLQAETFDEWCERVCLAANWLNVDVFSPYGIPDYE